MKKTYSSFINTATYTHGIVYWSHYSQLFIVDLFINDSEYTHIFIYINTKLNE